jgi:MoxR-like ATPase
MELENMENDESVGAEDLVLFEQLAAVKRDLVDEIGKVIVGQRDVVEAMLVAMFAGGHCLFIGVPGLAKTLLVSTTARALGLDFSRIQFTPDLMPADITGTEVLQENRETGERSLRFIKGPIFTNLLLADEINRTPPKTQAALLQAMQEGEVTSAGENRTLSAPFLVFATQNPIEQGGTYPLPEAQLDRFMFSIDVGYPTLEDEIEIVKRTTTGQAPEVTTVLGRDKLIALQGMVRRLPSNGAVDKLAVRLARATRPGPDAPEGVNRWVQWGAGPRASQYLSLGARVRAALNGEEVPHPDDLFSVAPSVLSHRILLNFKATAAGVTVGDVLDEIVDWVKRER